MRQPWILVLLLTGAVRAQSDPTVFWVRFTDKASTPYSLAAPEEFLSARAIERRLTRSVELDELDLPVDPAYIATVLAQGDIQLINRSKWFNGITIRTLDPDAMEAVMALPFVEHVESTRMLQGAGPLHDKFQPSFTTGGQRGGEPQDYGPSFLQISMMNGHLLHAMEAKGQGMLIGVLDSGFDRTDELAAFEHLRAREGIILTRDMVTHDGDVYADHWHGRSVLSCMAGILEGQLQGTAPAADYVLVRTEDAGMEYRVEEDNWVAGAELCDSIGCDILNTSLGYTQFDDSLQDHTYADMNGTTTRISIAAGIASRKGMIPVCSAGNSGESSWYYISAPADAVDILAVGAVGDVGNSAPFSSHGPSSDGRVKPDACAMGWGAIGLRSEGDSIAQINGTSFASPILAGLVACLWQLHPERTAHDIMHAVRRSASQYAAPDADYGYGIPDFIAAHQYLNMTTGLTVAADRDQWGVFPVPFQDELFIQVPGSADGILHVSLLDLTGRSEWSTVVQRAKGNVNVRDPALARLTEGAYVLRATINGSTTSRTIVKVR